MVQLSCDSCVSVNSERGRRKPAVRAACYWTSWAGPVATGPHGFLQELAVGNSTFWTHRHRKSLALPEDADGAGQTRSFPPPRVLAHLISSMGTAGSTEALPAPTAPCKAPWYPQPSPGVWCHHPGHCVVPGMAVEMETSGGVCNSSSRDDTAPLQ